MSLRARQPVSSTSDDSTTLEPPTSHPQTPSALSQTLTSTANLAKLLPTGTLLAFQLLTPIFTNNGSCDTATRPLTAILLVTLAVSCFLACFTDSFKSEDGQLYYGFATFQGMWLFDYYELNNVPDLRKYRLRFIDWVHALLSVLVFGTVALRDRNVVNCFYPSPGHEAQEVLDIVPIGVGLLSSALFVVFPTRRHGIGYPITPNNKD
ncbi:DMP3-like protein [Tanacetum coccineum]